MAVLLSIRLETGQARIAVCNVSHVEIDEQSEPDRAIAKYPLTRWYRMG